MCELAARHVRRIRVTPFSAPGLPGQCWEWIGAVDRGGHGRVKVDGRTLHVRRVVVEAREGKLTRDDHVVGLCGYVWCVNADHLVVGAADEVRALGRFGRLGIGDDWLLNKFT